MSRKRLTKRLKKTNVKFVRLRRLALEELGQNNFTGCFNYLQLLYGLLPKKYHKKIIWDLMDSITEAAVKFRDDNWRKMK